LLRLVFVYGCFDKNILLLGTSKIWYDLIKSYYSLVEYNKLAIGGKIMGIRLAKIDDEEKISILIAQFRVELRQLKGIKSIPKIDQAKEEFREYIEAKYPIFVAENGNELLGYLVCRIDGGIVWAESIFVSNSARRSGIASKLYEEAENIARELGGTTVFNWVHPNNDKMISFLSKMGYNVLNLIEIRKPWENEVLTQKICVGNHKYNY